MSKENRQVGFVARVLSNAAFMLRFRRFRIAAAVYLVVALVCTQIPLLDYLGYEFSFVVGLISSGISGLLAIGFAREIGPDEAESGNRRARRTVFGALGAAMALLAIPLTVISCNALVVKNCSFVQGLAFFLLLPCFSTPFAFALGVFCAGIFRFARTWYGVIAAVTLCYNAALGYFTPAIFSYNVFYGYFPGFTYDELLEIPPALAWFRLITAVLAALLLAMAFIVRRYAAPGHSAAQKIVILLQELVQPRRVIFTAAAAVGLALVYVFRCDMGLEATTESIRAALGSEYRTEHFIIVYSGRDVSADEIRWIAAEHEFRLFQVMRDLSLTRQRTITSFLYPTEEMKRRLIGAGATDFAKPWSAQIHLTEQSIWHSLRHELVHVVAAPFGVPVLHASLSPGLTEGIAMALSGTWGSRTLHQYAAAMRIYTPAPDISGLMSVRGFFTQSSSISYVLAGSFCRFLIDRFGIRKAMLVYRSGDFEANYGRSLESLLQQWQRFLTRVPVNDGDRDAVDALFRRPPIFRKVCVRAVAARNRDAAKEFAGKRYANAEAMYEATYRETGSFEALGGYLASALRLGQWDLLMHAYDSAMVRDPHPARFLPLYLLVGDAAWELGMPDSAAHLYAALKGAAISADYTNAASIRLHALGDPSMWRQFLAYLASDDPDSAREAILDSATRVMPARSLVDYMMGRMFCRQNRFAESLKRLSTAAFGVADPQLETFRLELEGEDLLRLKRYQEARSAFWISLNWVDTEAAEMDAGDRIERCDWLAEHGLP